MVSTEPGVSPPLSFGLLGPLLVEVGGRPVELTGSRTKAVLAILLAHANSVVSADRLIDDLWAGKPTPGAPVTLQGYVSDLRRALTDALGEPAPVVTRRPGYLVRITPDQLDVLRFERLIAEVKAVARHDVGTRPHGVSGPSSFVRRSPCGGARPCATSRARTSPVPSRPGSTRPGCGPSRSGWKPSSAPGAIPSSSPSWAP